MSTYKLSYFDIRGLAETARLIFAVAGVTYEDFRFPFKAQPDGTFNTDEWKAVKGNENLYTWDKLPVLEVTDGGKHSVIAQSKAIERFLSKRFGLYGSSDLEAAVIDSVVEQVSDKKHAFYSAKGKDEAVKAAGATVEADKTNLAKYGSEEVGNFLKMFDRVLTNAGGNFFSGGRLSLADISFFVAVSHPMFPQGHVDKFPKLAALMASVGNNERIAAWIKKRPQTIF